MGSLEIFATPIVDGLRSGGVRTKDDLQSLKQRIAREHGVAVPKDSELLAILPTDVAKQYLPVLRTKPMRTGSGVAVLAVMSSPEGCPHGKCVYCPGGPEVDAPQSYTGFEPSTMRAKRHGYDPYQIAVARLAQLRRNGHSTDKVDVVIQGGTFPARTREYQDWFVAGIYAGCNQEVDSDEQAWADFEEWKSWPASKQNQCLRFEMDANESSSQRIIGLTIETKPDWCMEEHVDKMLRYGCTRVELGIQTLDEETTKFTNRGHTVQDGADALRILRDAGLKVCVHMMPGLPRPKPDGSIMPDPEMDEQDMERLFAEPEWRPDMLKIYPTMVVHEGETPLKKWWKEGRYEPYDTAAAAEVVAKGLAHVPPWCRVQRVLRDIPSTHVEAGVKNSNLRQFVDEQASKTGVVVREMRSREVHRRESEPENMELVHRQYEASGGTELFVSWEDRNADAIAGFVRLRLVGPKSHRPEFQDKRGAAVIRELKVYGTARPIGAHDHEVGSFQHQGLGAKLLHEAERIAFDEWGVGRLVVTSGVGVRAYYRDRGYHDEGPYVVKIIQ